MQIALSAVFPLVFCFLWLFVVAVVLSVETEELRDEQVLKKGREGGGLS